MRPKDKSHVAGNRRGKYYNVLRSIDILFLVINPTHRDCEMKFVFLESADISAYKLFKAFSRMKGMTNSAITIGGIQSISSKRPLHLADINHAMKKFIPEINRFFPDVKDSGFKKVPQVYVVGERGLKKSDKRIAE